MRSILTSAQARRPSVLGAGLQTVGPDIRAVKQSLIAAKVARFPQVSLRWIPGRTGYAAFEPFLGPPGVELRAAGDAACLRGWTVETRMCGWRKGSVLVEYQRSIGTAFREVSDALTAH